MMTCMGAKRSSKFSQIRPPTAELAALEHLKKNPHRLIMGKRVATFSRLFLIRSISYLHRVATVREKSLENEFFSRSGKSQGISILVREI